MIPLMLGNLGASAIIDAAKGKRDFTPHPMLGDLERLRDLGVTAIEDYVGWNVIEPSPGRVDASLHVAHREAVERAGLRYLVYPWVHALPDWLRDDPTVVRFRCLEHDRDGSAPSLFAPRTLELYQQFYATVRHELGEPDQLTLALPCDYGEFGYPAGFGAWVLDGDAGESHAHDGFWAADEYARRAFRESMLSRHGSLPAVNRAHGTDTSTVAALRPPRDPASAAIHPALRDDFLRFYREALLTFTEQIARLARREFPAARLAIKCGYGGEAGTFGMDYTRLGALARALDLDIWSTHGTLPVVFHKRIQTICRHFDVRYVTEAPNERRLDDTLDRLFEDASDGAAGFFEFHEAFVQHETEVRRRLPLLSGDPPIVDIALLFHTTGQEQNPRQGFPPSLLAIGEPLRDAVDYEVVDEELITAPGALGRYRVVAVPDGGPLRPQTIERLLEFAREGGVVVTTTAWSTAAPSDVTPLTAPLDPTGRDDWLELFADPPPTRLAFDGDDVPWLIGRFHQLESAAPYFGGGADSPCRWTSGRSGFRFAAGRVQLSLWAPDEARPGEWRVYVDGGESQARLTTGRQVISIDAPSRDDGRLIEFELRGPSFRPAHTPSGEDRRDLGLLLREAWIESNGEATGTGHRTLTSRVDLERLSTRLRRHGDGLIVLAPPQDLQGSVALIHIAAKNSEALRAVTRGETGSPTVTLRRDGLRVTRLPGRWLLYNRAAATRSRNLMVDGRPLVVTLEPREMREVRGAEIETAD